MNEETAGAHDSKNSLMLFLVLDGFIRLLIWYSSLAMAVGLFTWFERWPQGPLVGATYDQAWVWGARLGEVILLFNVCYLAHLVVLRLLIPTPKPGRYEIGPGKKLDRQLLWASLIATLTKARYEAPFPGFLVFHLANLPPMKWLMAPVFGPKSKSCYVTDPKIIDPYAVTVGRNVTIGMDAIISGHYQDKGVVVLQPTIIEDDVVIGALAAMAGVHVKRGAVIGAGSILMPGAVVGEGELWSGNPARRRRIATEDDRKAAAMKPAEEKQV